MATLREYFDVDFNNYMSVHKTWKMKSETGATSHSLIAEISQAFDANEKFWSFFLHQEIDIYDAVSVQLNVPF